MVSAELRTYKRRGGVERWLVLQRHTMTLAHRGPIDFWPNKATRLHFASHLFQPMDMHILVYFNQYMRLYLIYHF